MPLQACIKCYRVWQSRKMDFDLVDLKNLKTFNQLYIICKECNEGKETSILKNEDGTFEGKVE